MREFKNLITAMTVIALIGFVSCSDNIDDNRGGDDPLAETYLSINISMPNGDPSSKSDAEHSGAEENATADENEVITVNLYFFDDATDAFVDVVDFTNSELNTPSTDLVTSTKKKTSLAKGTTYKVFAIVNGAASMTPTTVGDFLDEQSTGSFFTAVPGTGLVMASRTITGDAGAHISSPWVRLAIAANNSETLPATLQLQVERTVGKLVLSSVSNNEYVVNDLSSSPIATVTLTEYTVVNTTKEWFTFRHTAEAAQVNVTPTPAYHHGNIITGLADYAMDPLTNLKATIPPSSDLIYPAWVTYWTGYYDNHVTSIGTATYTSMPTTINEIVGYCQENTIPQAFQKNGYSTGVVFKAHVAPVEILEEVADELAPMADPTSITDFYHYNGKFYKNIDAINLAYTSSAVATADATNAVKLKNEYGIDFLVGGVCYYKYWIKHQDNDVPGLGTDPNVMGVMEFAIVRNNVYKMQVNSISGIGSGIPDIEPGDDNETTYSYLNMEMSIRPWIVRTNEINL